MTKTTLYNVCSVHRGMFSTSGGYHEYIGGYHEYTGSVQYIGGYHDACGGYHEYIVGCSVHWRIPWVHRRISWVHWGMFSTSGDIMMHVGEQVDKNLSIFIENPNVLNIPRCTHDIPRCTHGTHGIPPMYWTSPDVLMVSPTCIMISPMYWTSPDVLMISPLCTYGSPPMYWTSPMYSWYPPMYWTPPMYSWYPPMYSWYPLMCWTPRCPEHTLYRVLKVKSDSFAFS